MISRTVGACLMTNLNKVLAYALKSTGLTFVLVFWEDDLIRTDKLSTIRIKFCLSQEDRPVKCLSIVKEILLYCSITLK